MFWASRNYVVLIEMHDYTLVTIYASKLEIFSTIWKPEIKFLSHTTWQSSFITKTILFLHGRSGKSLFNPFARNSSSCYHKNKARSKFSVIKTINKLRLTNDLKLINFFIGQHVILSSLQKSKDLFNVFPMIKICVNQISPKSINSKINIETSILNYQQRKHVGFFSFQLYHYRFVTF